MLENEKCKCIFARKFFRVCVCVCEGEREGGGRRFREKIELQF